MERPFLSLIGIGIPIGFLVTLRAIETETLFIVVLATIIFGSWLLAETISIPLATLLGLVVRIPFVVLAPVHDDSAIYYATAEQLAGGNIEVTQHFGVELVMAVFVFIFGQQGANLASFTASVFTVPIAGAAATNLFSSRRAGIAAALASAVIPVHIYFSSWAYTEPISLLFFSLALYALVANRYPAAAVLTIVVAFMRLEYAVLILLPLLSLQLFGHRITRRRVAGIAAAGAGTIVLVSTLYAFKPGIFLNLFNYLGYSRTFLNTFSSTPIMRMAYNLSFYTVHFLHWGVPYWKPILVNPLLPLFFFIGVFTLLPRTRLAWLAPVFGFGTIVFTLLIREFFGIRTSLSAVYLIVICTITLLLLLAIVPSGERRFYPLIALIPYVFLLLILYRAPRYLLPVVIVCCLYAGQGMERLYSTVVTEETIRAWIPAKSIFGRSHQQLKENRELP